MLTTPRLILRDMRPDDVAWLAEYQSNPDYLRHYAEKPDAAAIVRAAIAWAGESPRRNLQFAVVLADEKIGVGCAGLRRRGYPPGEAELGVEIDPGYWRRGLATEALGALIEYGTTALGLVRYWAITAPANPAANALLEGLRFHAHDTPGGTRRLARRVVTASVPSCSAVMSDAAPRSPDWTRGRVAVGVMRRIH